MNMNRLFLIDTLSQIKRVVIPDFNLYRLNFKEIEMAIHHINRYLPEYPYLGFTKEHISKLEGSFRVWRRFIRERGCENGEFRYNSKLDTSTIEERVEEYIILQMEEGFRMLEETLLIYEKWRSDLRGNWGDWKNWRNDHFHVIVDSPGGECFYDITVVINKYTSQFIINGEYLTFEKYKIFVNKALNGETPPIKGYDFPFPKRETEKIDIEYYRAKKKKWIFEDLKKWEWGWESELNPMNLDQMEEKEVLRKWRRNGKEVLKNGKNQNGFI